MKGRLLSDQLITLEAKAKATFNQLINEWTVLNDVTTLLQDKLFKSLLRLLDNNHHIIMSANRDQYTYPHLVKTIEVMIWLQRKEELIQKSTNKTLIIILKKTEEDLKNILTTTVQCKTFPNEQIVKNLDPISKDIIAKNKHAELKDNLAEMILLAILNIVNSSKTQTIEEEKFKKVIIQLLNNTRYKWNTSALLHVREDDEGNKYKSYENKKTYLGLIAILNLVFSDKTAKNNKILNSLSEYFKEMSTKNILTIADHLTDKEKKDIEKGIIRNNKGKFSIDNFQYCPIKTKEPSQTSKDLQVALESIISNLYYRKNSIAFLNERNECIISVSNEKNEKHNFNITQLLRNQPLMHEINLSEELILYFTTATTGSELYLVNSSVDIHAIIQNKECNQALCGDTHKMIIHPGSCIISYTLSPEKKSILSINGIYYFDLRKKIKQVAENNAAINIGITQIIKKTLIYSEMEKSSIYQIENNGPSQETFKGLHHLFAKEKILFLKRNFIIQPQKNILEQGTTQWPYSELSMSDNSATNVYTGHFYNILQPEERNYYTAKIPFDKNDPIISKYIKKFGDHTKDPQALYQMKIETLTYSYFNSHALAKLIQINQQHELEKIQVDTDNCQLFIATNQQMVEDYKLQSQQEAIILFISPNKKEMKIYHCIDNKFTKKIMEYDLVVTISQENFLHFVEDKTTFLIILLSINRIHGLVKPTTQQEKDMVNMVLKQATWHCVLNTFNVRFNRTDIEGFYVNCVRPHVIINGIKEDGCVLSAANEFVSTSWGIATQFLTQDGYQIFTVVHVPNGFTPIIMKISDSPGELEALFGPNSKLVYFKVEFTSSFRGVIYHAIPTDYDFQLTDQKWSKFVSAQIKSELNANIKICNSALDSTNAALSAEFSKVTSQAKTDQEAQALNNIEEYFNQSKNHPAFVQKSCLEGTPLHILFVNITGQIKKQLEDYCDIAHLTNCYVIIPVNQLYHHPVAMLKIYYVKYDGSIITVLPNVDVSNMAILKEIAQYLLEKSNVQPAKEWLDNRMLQLNHIISQANNTEPLPLLIGVAGVNDNIKITNQADNLDRKKIKNTSIEMLHKIKPKINHSLYHGVSKRQKKETSYQDLREKIQKKLLLEEEIGAHKNSIIHEKTFEKNGMRERNKSKLPIIVKSVQDTLSILVKNNHKRHKSPRFDSSSEDKKPSIITTLSMLSDLLKDNNENNILPILNDCVATIISYIAEKHFLIKLENNIDLLIFLHLAKAIYAAFPSGESAQKKSIKDGLISLTNQYPLHTINSYLNKHYNSSINLKETVILDENGYNVTHSTVSKLDTLTKTHIDKYNMFLRNSLENNSLSNQLSTLDDNIAEFLKLKENTNLSNKQNLLMIKNLLTEIQIKFNKIKPKYFLKQEIFDIYKNLLNSLIAWTNHIYPEKNDILLIESRVILSKPPTSSHKKDNHHHKHKSSLCANNIDTTSSTILTPPRKKKAEKKNTSINDNIKVSNISETPSVLIDDSQFNNNQFDLKKVTQTETISISDTTVSIISETSPVLINSQTNTSEFDLQKAIQTENSQEVQHILADKTEKGNISTILKSKDTEGQTALHQAVMLQGNSEQKCIIIKSLLFYHVKNKINIDDIEIQNEQPQMMRLLDKKYGYYKARLKTPDYVPKFIPKLK